MAYTSSQITSVVDAERLIAATRAALTIDEANRRGDVIVARLTSRQHQRQYGQEEYVEYAYHGQYVRPFDATLARVVASRCLADVDNLRVRPVVRIDEASECHEKSFKSNHKILF